MRLKAPAKAPQLQMTDIQGRPVSLGAGPQRELVCFFRDAACPFCNFRIYLLASHYEELARCGLRIVALFYSTPEEVKHFVSRNPRPFPVIADPASQAYDAYHIERSSWRKLKAILTRLPDLVRGLRIVGLAGLKTNNILPADFLVDEDGNIVEAYYGRDAGDHIPLERIETFAVKGMLRRTAATDSPHATEVLP